MSKRSQHNQSHKLPALNTGGHKDSPRKKFGKTPRVIGRIAWRIFCFVPVVIVWVLLEFFAARLALVFALALAKSDVPTAFGANADSIVVIAMAILVTTLSAGVLLVCRAVYRFIRDLVIDRDASLGKVNEWLIGHTHPATPIKSGGSKDKSSDTSAATYAQSGARARSVRQSKKGDRRG